MSNFVRFIEKMFWGIAGLAVSLVILFAVLHILKSNSVAQVPVVGAPVAGAANWVGAHAQSY